MSPVIRVCHVISGDLWAGAEAQALSMLVALRTASGVELSAVVLNEGRLSARLREHGIEVLVLDESRLGVVALARAIGAHLRARAVDIVHAHRYKENLLSVVATRFGLRARLVQTVHGVQERVAARQPLKVRGLLALDAFLARHAFARVLAVSRDITVRIARTHGRHAVRYLPNAIDLDAVRPARARELVRAEFGWGPTDVVFAIVGRLVPIKGLEVFLAAAARMAGRDRACRFAIVGEGPLAVDLKEQVKTAGLAERVTFTGFRDDVPDLVRACDVFTMTSWHEGVPVALLEAMALDRPVLATRVGGIGEVAEEGVTAILCAAGDDAAIADAGVRLARDPALRAKMGAAGRARVEREYSAAVQRDRLLAIYSELFG